MGYTHNLAGRSRLPDDLRTSLLWWERFAGIGTGREETQVKRQLTPAGRRLHGTRRSRFGEMGARCGMREHARKGTQMPHLPVLAAPGRGGGAAYSGSAVCLRSAEIGTGGLGVGRLFYFFNAAGSGSRCHSSEPDWRRGREMSRETGEKEMEASMLQEEGRKEKGRGSQEKRCGQDGLGLAASCIFPRLLRSQPEPETQGSWVPRETPPPPQALSSHLRAQRLLPRLLPSSLECLMSSAARFPRL